MTTPRIKSTAILIGFSADGRCVYSEILSIHDYYDNEHVWDRAVSAKKLKLQRIRGYLFNEKGLIDQEFESEFDPATGKYKSGISRHADGTVVKD